MEQTHCPTSENLQLERLVAGARGEIERLGYSRRSRNRYRAIWEHLIAFSRWKELGDEFSTDLAAIASPNDSHAGRRTRAFLDWLRSL